VFCTSVGTALDAANVRRSFRRVAAAAGLDAQAWTPRELRHSFVSLLSSTGMSIEDISHLLGHASSRVTELVYRKELRPVPTRGASAMDALFPHEKPGLGKQLGKRPSRDPRRGRSGSQGSGSDQV
jgi:site-specific recombinase XerD